MEAEAKPMTNEAIVFTEKKMAMSFDEIVKMSKKSNTNNWRASNKSRKSFNTGAAQKSSAKVRQYIDSRSSVRQGVLAKKRSNFNGNQFPLTTGVAKKAAVAPFSNRTSNGNWTRNKSYKGTERQWSRRSSLEETFLASGGNKKQRPHRSHVHWMNVLQT